MSSGFVPHAVDWTATKVERFWDYLGRHQAGEFFSEKHRADLAARLIGRAEPKVVVDIGCGTGPLVSELARRGVRSIGIDTSTEVLAIARAQAVGLDPMPEFHLGSATQIPLAEDSVDAAVLIEVVEHLDNSILDQTFDEVRRVLRPGGTLMITTPNDEDLEAATRQCPDCGAEFHVFQHVRRWTVDSLQECLRSARFTDVSVTPATFVERGRWFERLVPIGFRLLGRKPPRLLAFAVVEPTGRDLESMQDK